MNNLKATFKENDTKFNGKNRKENNYMGSYNLYSLIDGQLRCIVDCRIYGTDARNYACVWVNSEKVHTSGSDFAGGYGYHRASAALEGAFNDAGFTFSESINGRGDSSMEEAILSVGEALELENMHFVRTYG